MGAPGGLGSPSARRPTGLEPRGAGWLLWRWRLDVEWRQLVGDKVSPRKPRRRWNKKKGRASGGSGDSGGAESEAQDGARGGDGEARRKDRNARRKKLPRLKTRMCRHIDAPDGCPFGQACRFAHSSAELREPPVQTSAAQASNEKGGSKERQGNGVEMLKIHT